MGQNQFTPEQQQQVADKINALLKEKKEIHFNSETGCTLEKNQYVEQRTSEINNELTSLKNSQKPQ